MARGGARSGAGRPQGSINRKTREIAEAAVEAGLTPLEYMLSVMRDTEQQMSARLDAAKSAAPYIHPRLAAVEHSGPDGGEIPVGLRVIELVAVKAIDGRPG